MGCLALAIAMARLHPFTPTQAVIALIAATAARLLIPFFATDQDGKPVPCTTTTEGDPQCPP